MVEFIATEAGFADGLGGAANADDTTGYHYVLFGRQSDEQCQENSGVYFEYDDQINGGVNIVKNVAIADSEVIFKLNNELTIVVRQNTANAEWQAFLQGLQDVFESYIAQ
jgi:hypothetical protein